MEIHISPELADYWNNLTIVRYNSVYLKIWLYSKTSKINGHISQKSKFEKKIINYYLLSYRRPVD